MVMVERFCGCDGIESYGSETKLLYNCQVLYKSTRLSTCACPCQLSGREAVGVPCRSRFRSVFNYRQIQVEKNTSVRDSLPFGLYIEQYGSLTAQLLLATTWAPGSMHAGEGYSRFDTEPSNLL